MRKFHPNPRRAARSGAIVPGDAPPLQMDVLDIRVEPREQEPYQQVIFVTSRGDVACHYYAPQTGDGPGAISSAAVLFLSGAVGGFHSPARSLYPRLAGSLAALGIASLHIAYRHSTVLPEATLDALAGLTFLRHEGFTSLGLVGHSFGGAVAINAAAGMSQSTRAIIRAVVTLATQSSGVESARSLKPSCALLLFHGSADELLPTSCSRYVRSLATCPAELRILVNAGHYLTESADDVYEQLERFLPSRLRPAPALQRILRLGKTPTSR